jgi:hypothetical protein
VDWKRQFSLTRKETLFPSFSFLILGKVIHSLHFKTPLSKQFISLASKNVEKGSQVCLLHQVPLHIYGRNTFSYLVKRRETEQIGSSLTIDLNDWIPCPPLPQLVTNMNSPFTHNHHLIFNSHLRRCLSVLLNPMGRDSKCQALVL